MKKVSLRIVGDSYLGIIGDSRLYGGKWLVAVVPCAIGVGLGLTPDP